MVPMGNWKQLSPLKNLTTALDGVEETLKRHPGLTVEIAGHTDSLSRSALLKARACSPGAGEPASASAPPCP